MLIAVVGVSALMIGASAPRAVVPTRLQSAAELSYEFVATMVRSTAGTEGMSFFPFVFTLFMFVLIANMIGLIPYAFTVTSHIIITAALALTVFLTVLGYGFWRHGLHFFNLFVPKGVPMLHPAGDRGHRGAVVHVAADLAQRASVRQHAGRPHHAAGVRRLHHPARRRSASLGWFGAVLPFAMMVALTALELLVAFLQAYVFAILTCIYLNDAIHPGH